jgi:endonuclease/exonuclease/phosphatase family metal-dependent hydrolase
MAFATSAIKSSRAEFGCCGSRLDLGNKCRTLALRLATPMHDSSEAVIRSVCTPISSDVRGNYLCLEKTKRAFTVVFHTLKAPVTVPAAILGGCFDFIGDRLAQKNYMYLRGTAPESFSKELTLLTFNACMFWGGIPLVAGGLSPARERVTQIADAILAQDPGIVVLQEVSLGPALKLHEKIQAKFAHTFTRIGPNPFKMESGLFLASKLPILGEPKFFPFEGQSGIKRGVFYIETSHYFVFTSHLEAGDSAPARQMRRNQLNFIHGLIQNVKKTTDKPCILAGDLNINRKGEKNDEYSLSPIPRHFYDPYFQKCPKAHEEVSTCTNVLSALRKGKSIREDRWEIDDYTLLDKSSASQCSLSVQLIPAFDLDAPKKALSDHHMLLAHAKLNQEDGKTS